MEDTYNRYFLRLKVEDRCGVLAEMTAIFAKYHVSVAQIIQKDTKVEGCAEVVVITEKVRKEISVLQQKNSEAEKLCVKSRRFFVYTANKKDFFVRKELKNFKFLILYKR